MRLTLADTLADRYRRLAPRGKTIESTVIRQLDRFKDIALDERVIVVRAADREAIETTLGRSVTSGAALADAIAALTVVTISGAALALSEKTLEALQRRAAFDGKAPAAVLQDFLTELEGELTSMVLT